MTIRNGFVSNSSSSSFLIASKGDVENLAITVNIGHLINQTIATEEELTEYFLDNYGYDSLDEMAADEPDLMERYNEHLVLIRTGMKLYAGSAGQLAYYGFNDADIVNGELIYSGC